jgi:hypothetical protein
MALIGQYNQIKDKTLAGPMGNETFEKCPILFKVKENENSNHPREICFAFHRAGSNTLSISRIKI